MPSRRHRIQFSLWTLAALIGVISIICAWYASGRRPQQLRIEVHSDAVYVNQRRTTWEDLPEVLRNHAKRMAKFPSAYQLDVVRILVDDDATYGDFKRALEITWQAAFFRHFCVNAAGVWCIVHPEFLGDRRGSGGSLRVQMSAGEGGELKSISSTCKRTVTRFPATRNDTYRLLHAQAAETTGYFDPPGPFLLIPPPASLSCDDELKFCHVKEALHALTVHIESDGTRVRMIEHIALLPKETATHDEDTSDTASRPSTGK
jgi:hypothetical protein